MNFDEETLIEIEEYIQALDEQVGLKPETILDINKAITNQRKLVKNTKRLTSKRGGLVISLKLI